MVATSDKNKACTLISFLNTVLTLERQIEFYQDDEPYKGLSSAFFEIKLDDKPYSPYIENPLGF